jgi:hypothetical protein
MKTYGNHFKVEDSKSCSLQTFDSGVVFVFDMPTTNAFEVFVNYVGIFKNILKPDYGPVHTLVIIFRCKWIKREDNRGNTTYVRDDIGFLTINFCHKLPLMFKPFIFPSQETRVFFSDDIKMPSWKVGLWKKVRSRRKVADIEDVFITTTMEMGGLSARITLPAPPSTMSLIGAIELSDKNNILALARF